jgi:outer membrane lipoprotein-sorting protein
MNMDRQKGGTLFFLSFVSLTCVSLIGCGMQPVTNTTTANTNTNSNSNTNLKSSYSSTSTSVETKEPDQYQATVTLKVQALGSQQTTELPPLSAIVARKDGDRRMEFTTPAGGRVVYLDKGGTTYLVLPDKKQYAELNKESLGFDVRRMLMPEQIVDQVKNVKGMERVGDDTYNGRNVVKYKYGAVANTQTRAGQVTTDSYLYVDKETGLPLHSETVSQSQSGGNVQGYNGVRMIIEITGIKTDVSPDLFAAPTDLQKIDAAQVRTQVDIVFNALAAVLSQAMQQAQSTNTSSSASNTSASPVRR